MREMNASPVSIYGRKAIDHRGDSDPISMMALNGYYSAKVIHYIFIINTHSDPLIILCGSGSEERRELDKGMKLYGGSIYR